MQRTLSQAFDDFHKKLVPSSYESGKASSHKGSIENCLAENYSLRQLFYSGSAQNGTSISKHSDVDFFAVIPYYNLKDDSSQQLREIKECLQSRFPLTHIYVDNPAIVIDFGSYDWDTCEIIPANSLGEDTYQIPGQNGGWIKSSPKIHKAYVTKHHQRLNNKLKPLIRFLKAWKYFCDVPISSFYLELCATELMKKETCIVYNIDIVTIINHLYTSNLPRLQDPCGISGSINPCSSETNRQIALNKLRTAKELLDSAKSYECNKDMFEVFECWNKFFGGKFPSYYYY